MADYNLTETEAEHILGLPKWVSTLPRWRTDENENERLEVPVECAEQLPLRWYARINPRTGGLTTILFYRQINVRRLDVGQIHHNPDCHDTGPVHKHRWQELRRDHYAYEPLEIALADPPAEILRKFLLECNIELRVALPIPPADFQADLGV